MNIEQELELKRLKPEYIILQVENQLKKVDKTYPSSFNEVFSYNKRHKLFFSKIDKYTKHIEKLSSIAEKLAKNSEDFMELMDKRKDTTKNQNELNLLEKEFNELMEKDLRLEFDEKEFKQLVVLREDFFKRSNIGQYALSSLILNDIYKIVPKIIAFLGSFYFSYFFDDTIQKPFLILGPFFSKFLPALFIYLTVDALLEKLEEILLWKHCRLISSKLIKLNKLETDREAFAKIFNIKTFQ